MHRRHFLRALAIGAGVVAAPAPIRRYFFAPAGGWLETPQARLARQYREGFPRPSQDWYADPQTGLSLRMVRHYEVQHEEFVSRVDVLYGFSTLRPEYRVQLVAGDDELAGFDKDVIHQCAKDLADHIDAEALKHLGVIMNVGE